MKRLIIILIKLIPLYTLYRGAMKGHNRLKPLVNLGKVMLSQYEIKNITDLVVFHYKETQGKLVSQTELPTFLRNNYSDNYTMLARKVITKKIDYSLDVWREPFQISVKQSSGEVTIFSSGPDQKDWTKDDIKLSFVINGYQDVSKYQAQSNLVDDASDGYDSQGIYDEYDSEGYDRDGYDRDGYDREGFDERGLNRDGYAKDELREIQAQEQQYDNY